MIIDSKFWSRDFNSTNISIQVCGQLLGDNLSEDNVFYLLDVVDKYNCKYGFHIYERLNYILIVSISLILVNSPRSAAPFWQVPLQKCGRKTGPVSSPFILKHGLECSPTMSSLLGMLFLFASFWEFSLLLSPTTDLSRSCIIVSWHMQLNSKTIKHRKMKSLLSSCHVYDSTSFPLIFWSTRMSLLVCLNKYSYLYIS